uniref:DUF4283 domain-containing protein n=1 Tax=Quercus lobata TaxID=97700 RepID=A0A7N2LRC3_QUELO
MMASKVTFTDCPLWVQVWGLPFDLFSEEVGQEIGKGLGKLVEVDWKGSNSDQARFLRIRAEIPLDKPLQRGSQIMSPKGDVVWVAFRFERMQPGRKEAHKARHESRETPQSMPQPGDSGSRSGNPENQGTDMEIIKSHEWGRGVTEGHIPCPSVAKTLQTDEAIGKETNKEGEAIQKGINDKKFKILGEQLFCVPIIKVGTSQHPKPREIHPMNQARDALTRTKEKKGQKLNLTQQRGKDGRGRRLLQEKGKRGL